VALRIGTSGWAYDDWQGTVYPPSLAQSERLRWYATQFPTVEVDSTYYRDPAPSVVQGWVERTRGSPGFELSVKAPQTLTHEALVNAEPTVCAQLTEAWTALVARPLAQARRLGAVLLQLSPAVIHGPEALARLDAALSALAPLDVAVEFRNRSWHDEAGTALRPDALALLGEHCSAAVIVDGPSFPDIIAEQSSVRHAYVRFHGRNREDWFRRGASTTERYDYLYDDEELEPWATRLAELARSKDVVRTYFNNHVEGKAFQNARTMERMLADVGAPLERAVSPQRRLF